MVLMMKALLSNYMIAIVVRRVLCSIAIIYACIYNDCVVAQTSISAKNNADLLNRETPHAIVVKREINPGIVIFNRNNGCFLQSATYTNYLDNGIRLSTPYLLTGSGNTISEWRNEYKQPWKSQLTDYEGGESKAMLLQFGKHPSTLIRFEESDKKLLDAQTICAVGAYRIFGINMSLISPLLPPENNLSLPLNQGWGRNFTY
jgi:hypothetical protein